MMRKYLTGVKTLSEKEKKDQTEKQRKDYLTSYESQKRKRGVLPRWKIDRPWLRVETNEEQDIMFCDYCINAGISSDKSMFVKGSSSIRLESIKYHEGSNLHVLALSKHINKNETN